MKPLAISILALLFLTACRDTERQNQERLKQEREQRAETTKAKALSQYPNPIPFCRDSSSMPSFNLTIDVQEAIAASPSQLYWCDLVTAQFDIHRGREGLRLEFAAADDRFGGSDDGRVSLDCSEELIARIRKTYKPNHFLQHFLLVFWLSSASPLRIELKAENDGDSLSVKADNIAGRLYSGTLAGASFLDEDP